MKSHTEYLKVHTQKRREYINITPRVEEMVRKSGVKEGLVLVNAMHITASVYINDDERGLIQDFDDFLVERLKEPELAAEYLSSILEDGTEEEFLKAMRQVVEARGGMSKLALTINLNQADLYRIFSQKGNLEIQTLAQILRSLGLRLAVAA